MSTWPESADHRTMHDLYGALITRERLEMCVEALGTSEGLPPAVDSIDELFRAATVEDPDRWMVNLALDFGDESWLNLDRWWWKRTPLGGPIAHEIGDSKRRIRDQRSGPDIDN